MDELIVHRLFPYHNIKTNFNNLYNTIYNVKNNNKYGLHSAIQRLKCIK